MNLQLPMAARPLALLTVAVLAAHLLILGQTEMREPQRPPQMRTLVTRVLHIASSSRPPQAALTPPEPEGRTAGVRIQRARRNAPSPATPSEAASHPPAAALAESPAGAIAAPPSSPPSSPLASPPAAAAVPEPVIAAAAAAAPPAAPAMAFAIPGSVRLRYAVTGQSRGQPWNFNGELLWRHDGSQYEARLAYSSPLLPSRSQQSTGRITAEGLAPLRFSDKGRSEQATHFARDSGTVIFSSNAPQVPLLAGAQDRLSVFLQLAAMLAAEPAKFPAGTDITLQTAGTRDAQPWLFTVQADETLTLPGGPVATRKLIRLPRREYDVQVELWLGIGMDYVPVRIRLTQPNGDFVDQQWASTDKS